MASDDLRFEPVKVDRGWYFVEYSPPQCGNWFALMNVQVCQRAADAVVAEAMERELKIWLDLYAMPIMAFAWGDTGDRYELEGTRPYSCLTGFVDTSTGELKVLWREVGIDEAPRAAPTNEELLSVYADVPHEIMSEAAREKEALAKMHSIRIGKWLVITWLVIWGAGIPAGVAILEWAAPWWWLGALVLAYSLYKAVRQTLKLIGLWKPSARELAERERRSRMEMYYEGCERNPEGFARLETENLERETRLQIQTEARELREVSKDGR